MPTTEVDALLAKTTPVPFEVPFPRQANVPHAPGVYLVYADERLLYVGKTTDLRYRWCGHHRARELRSLGATELRWVSLPLASLTWAERLLIKTLQPRLNGKDIRLPQTPEQMERARARFVDLLGVIGITPEHPWYAIFAGLD